jgi:hypothetical protein
METLRNKWKGFLRKIGYLKEEKQDVKYVGESLTPQPELEEEKPQPIIVEPVIEESIRYHRDIESGKYTPKLIPSKNEPKTKLYKKCKLIFSHAHKLPPFVKLEIIGNRVYAYKEIGDYIMKSEDGNYYAFPSMKVGVELTTDEDDNLMVNVSEDAVYYPLVLGRYEGPININGRDASQQNFDDVGCIERFPNIIEEINNDYNPLRRVDEAIIAIEAFLTVVDPSQIRESHCEGFKKLTEKQARKSGKPITNENIIIKEDEE